MDLEGGWVGGRARAYLFRSDYAEDAEDAGEPGVEGEVDGEMVGVVGQAVEEAGRQRARDEDEHAQNEGDAAVWKAPGQFSGTQSQSGRVLGVLQTYR